MNRLCQLLVMVLITASSTTAHARIEQCRHIGNRFERDACYKRQDEARQAAQKAAEARPKQSASNAEEQLRLENERVSSKLNGICRGC